MANDISTLSHLIFPIEVRVVQGAACKTVKFREDRRVQAADFSRKIRHNATLLGFTKDTTFQTDPKSTNAQYVGTAVTYSLGDVKLSIQETFLFSSGTTSFTLALFESKQ